MSLRAKFLVNNNLSNTQSNNYGFRLRKDAWNILWYFCHFWSLFIWKTAIWTSLCLSQKSNVFGTAWWWVNEDRIWNSVNYKKKKKKIVWCLCVYSLKRFTPAGCCSRMPVASCWSMESRSQMGCVCISLSNTLTLVLVPSPSNAGYCRHTVLIPPSILQRTKQGMGVVVAKTVMEAKTD